MNHIEKLSALARRKHEEDCDTVVWDASLECDCGADAHNAKVDAVLAELGEVRTMYGDIAGSANPTLWRCPSAGLTAYLVIELNEPSGNPGESEAP